MSVRSGTSTRTTATLVASEDYDVFHVNNRLAFAKKHRFRPTMNEELRSEMRKALWLVPWYIQLCKDCRAKQNFPPPPFVSKANLSEMLKYKQSAKMNLQKVWRGEMLMQDLWASWLSWPLVQWFCIPWLSCLKLVEIASFTSLKIGKTW